MDALSVSLWLHLLAVVVWVGGVFFWTIVLFTRELPSDEANSWLETLGRRVYTIGWEALGLIVLTGLFNLVVRVQTGVFFQADYQRTLGTKLVLVGGMVALQLWQHFGLLPRLATAQADEASRSNGRRSLLVTSGLVLLLAAGALWFGVQLHHG